MFSKFFLFFSLVLIGVGFIALYFGVFGKDLLLVHSLSNADIFAFSGSIFAAAGLFFNAYIFKEERQKEESISCLNKYKETFEMLLACLESDKPTRRMAWIAASDMAKQMKKLENKINESTDAVSLKIAQRNYMNLLLIFFKKKSNVYFYGIDDAQNLDDAARKSEITSLDTFLSFPEKYSIDEDVILVILNLAQPAIQEFEPLPVPFSDEKGGIYLNVLKANISIFRGLFEYIEHVRNKNVHPG